MKMTRAFIAIDLPREIVSEIEKTQKSLPEFKGKFVEPGNLHLTLKFLGEIDDEKLNLVEETLKNLKFESFNLTIDSLGVFSEEFIRIIWLHISGCEKLQKQIDDVLGDSFPKEKRFMSHLTIARVKSIRDKKEFLKGIKEFKFPEMAFKTENFKLKKSTLTKERAFYEDLGIFNSYSHKN